MHCVTSDGSGSIDRDEFLQIPQIATNPLASRMIAIFDQEYVKIVYTGLCGLSMLVEEAPSIFKNLLVDWVLSAVEADVRKSWDVGSFYSSCSPSYLTSICLSLVAFSVYDVDRDGFISNGELFLVLKMMVGNNLKVHLEIRGTNLDLTLITN